MNILGLISQLIGIKTLRLTQNNQDINWWGINWWNNGKMFIQLG